MKLQISAALLACSLFCTIMGSAQTVVPLNEPNYNKPRLFSEFPEKAAVHITALENLLDLAVGTRVTASIAKNLTIIGAVVSKSNPTDQTVNSVVVKSLTRQGTTFTFTRITDPDGTVSYLGRMLNRHSGDALEIAKEGEGYVINKIEAAAILTE